MKEVNDVREYEDEDEVSKAAAGLHRDPLEEDDDAGHHNSSQGWEAPSLTLVSFIWQRKKSVLV